MPYQRDASKATQTGGRQPARGGNNAEIYQWAFFFVPLWLAALGTMGMLVWTDICGSADAWNDRRRYRKSRMVTAQAIRYVAVFYVTWVAGTTNRLLQLLLGRSYFWIMVLHTIFTPMQGFFNFLIYMHPQYRKWKKKRMIERQQHRRGSTKTMSVGSMAMEHTVEGGAAPKMTSNHPGDDGETKRRLLDESVTAMEMNFDDVDDPENSARDRRLSDKSETAMEANDDHVDDDSDGSFSVEQR